jgi:hypothetical protein
MSIGTTSRKSGLLSWLPYLVLGLAGAAIAAYATVWGPWTFSDGVGYMVSAKNLIDGPGLGLVKFSGEFEPLTAHPPAYSLLIALLYKLGLPLVSAARWIDIAAFGLFSGLIPGLYAKVTRSRWAGISAGMLFLAIPAVALHLLGAIAEPVFLTTGFAGLLTIAASIQSKQPGLIWLAAGLFAVSVLFRYPTASFVASACTVVLLASEAPLRTRAKRAIALATGSLAPAGLFIIYSMATRAAASPLALQPNLDLGASTQTLAKAMIRLAWEWKPIPPQQVLALFFPPAFLRPFQVTVAGLLAIAVAGLVAAAYLRVRGAPLVAQDGDRPILPITLGVTALAYLALVYAAHLIAYPTPDINQRTMLPLLILLVFATIEAVRWIVRGKGQHSRWPTGAALLLFAATLAGLAPSTVDIYRGLHQTGLGYTAAAWRHSPTLAAVPNLPPGTMLASNAPEAILLYTNQYPYSVANLQTAGACPAELRSLIDRGLIIVSFDPEALDGARTWDAEGVRAACDLQVLSTWKDGIALGSGDSP